VDPGLPFDRRVLVVSGKGGTGKSTVAAAWALAGARSGLRVCLVEVEGRGGLARLLEMPPPGFREQEGPLGIRVLEISPREALVEYLTVIAGLRGVSRPLRRARVVETATDAIPGFRDVLVAGKLYELTEWRDAHPNTSRRPYDLVVVDAPSTSQLAPFLRSPSAYRELIRAGRASRQLARIEALVQERTRVALVAVPEEMAVVETLETAEALADLGIAVGPILANRVLPPAFPPGSRASGLRLTPASLAEALAGVGLALQPQEAAQLLDAARGRDHRVWAQRIQIEALATAGPVIQLPFLFVDTLGRREVQKLAGLLLGQDPVEPIEWPARPEGG
jgi:anion-transporting  ArsA/GET3 family ATPase